MKDISNTSYWLEINLCLKCILDDLPYGDFKNLKRRTAADKVLRDKACNIAKNPKYDGHQRELASMVYKFFDKKTKGSGVT